MRKGMQVGARVRALSVSYSGQAHGGPASRQLSGGKLPHSPSQRSRFTGRSLRTALLGALLACVLLAGFSVSANASTTNDVRGEWSFVVTCSCEFPAPFGGHSLPGTAIISKINLTTGEFTGSGAIEGLIPTALAGTITENNTTLVVTLTTPEGAVPLTTEGTVSDAGGEISTSGTWIAPPGATGTFVGKRIRSYQAVVEEEEKKAEEAKKAREEQEAKEVQEAKEAKEAQEVKEAEQKNKEAQERAAKEKTEKEAKVAQEAKAKAEAEAKAAQAAQAAQAAKEAKEREEREKSSPSGGQPAGLAGKAFTATGSGLIALGLSNSNDYSISGEITLSSATAGRASHSSAKGKKAVVLASASYTISSQGNKTVKLKLSKSGLAALKRQKTLHAVVKITTAAAGQPTTTKTYNITLKAAAVKHH